MPVLSTTAITLTGGRIWTGDPRQPFAEAAGILGDRIVVVGSTGEVLAAMPPARRIDLEGRLAVPGFIDNHAHLSIGGFQLSRVDLRSATSTSDLITRISAHATRLGADEWVLGGNWDETAWTPVELPRREMIDACTHGRPVLLTRLDVHTALANSAALRMAGIDRTTPDPPGGRIERDSGGEPTGILRDAAIDLVSRVIPPPTIDQRATALRAALAEAARFGVTSVCDMSWTDAYDDLLAYQRIPDAGMNTRVALFTPLALYERLASASIETRFGGPMLRIGGLKAFADGSLGSGTAAFFDPLTDEPGNRGLLTADMANGGIDRWTAAADAHGLQVAIHAIGDRAVDQVLRIFERWEDPRSRRFRIEHAQHLNPSLIERLARSGIIASVQPYHLVDDGRWAGERIGPERSRHMIPLRSMLDAGVIVTFGSDWTVAPIDPLQGIAAAVTRRTVDGRNPDGWTPEERISVEEALRAYTVTNAWAMFAENEIGQIREGFLADIAVLSRDILTIDPAEIAGTKVDLTILGGRIVHGSV